MGRDCPRSTQYGQRGTSFAICVAPCKQLVNMGGLYAKCALRGRTAGPHRKSFDVAGSRPYESAESEPMFANDLPQVRNEHSLMFPCSANIQNILSEAVQRMPNHDPSSDLGWWGRYRMWAGFLLGRPDFLSRY